LLQTFRAPEELVHFLCLDHPLLRLLVQICPQFICDLVTLLSLVAEQILQPLDLGLSGPDLLAEIIPQISALLSSVDSL
jgi:hypothetical protein